MCDYFTLQTDSFKLFVVVLGLQGPLIIPLMFTRTQQFLLLLFLPTQPLPLDLHLQGKI